MHCYRTHNCGQLRSQDAGSVARLSGWVHRKRDHGNLLFVDLRDHYGLTQCVVDVSSPVFKVLEAARPESVVTLTGKVVNRSADTVNNRLPTGEIELQVAEALEQSSADVLPMQVAGEQEFPEDMRLRYRYLDLRREKVHANMLLRSQVIASLRRRMIAQDFVEYQTPILTASSPEGARDYLVVSRIHPGKFYALPQAPQQFKQLLMVAGFDKYFQVAPCFRDEDGRADRSPGEFYQLDFEMSFVTQEDVFAAIEPVLQGVFEEFGGGRKVTPAPFPRITYADAMLKYGSDKPDLRNPLLISDVTEAFRGSNFGIFAKAIDAKAAVVRAIPAPGAGDKPRSFFDKLNDWAREQGAGGLGYIIFAAEGAKGRSPRIWKKAGSPPSERRRGPRTATRCSSAATRNPSPRNSPVWCGPVSVPNSISWSRTSSSSAGPSISRCMNWTRTAARSSSRTIPSPCRKAEWRRCWRRIRWRSTPSNMTSSATVSNCRRGPSATIAPRSC